MTVTPEAVAAAFPDLEVTPEPLGSGTFKTAFRARQSGSELVLKIVKAPVDEVGAVLPERLRREIEAMRAVSSPHVVAVLGGPDAQIIGGDTHIWYLEPFYPNGTLDERLTGPWSEKRAAGLLAELISGVEAMWTQARLVHRDIKPANIAFSETDAAVLLDLGIALHIDLTPLTDELGISPRTVAYAAPEQFDIRRDAEIDFRTDLFLVGVVAFQALTGVHPFRAFDEPNDYASRLFEGAYDEEALSQCQASNAFKQILVRLLGPKPNQRFRKIEHAIDAVRDLQS